MATKQEVMFIDKKFVAGVIDALKSLDVRGYESNKRRTIVTMELERAYESSLPLTVEPNSPDNKDTGETEKAQEKK